MEQLLLKIYIPSDEMQTQSYGFMWKCLTFASYTTLLVNARQIYRIILLKDLFHLIASYCAVQWILPTMNLILSFTQPPPPHFVPPAASNHCLFSQHQLTSLPDAPRFHLTPSLSNLTADSSLSYPHHQFTSLPNAPRFHLTSSPST